eukprot:GHVP01017919.1.p1 GENE.GHVP01017919.1~~GHVP01017919.1.p1  ORF type:complete len:177 (-),score=28.71 GHVP01017919.1:237-719(-)
MSPQDFFGNMKTKLQLSDDLSFKNAMDEVLENYEVGKGDCMFAPAGAENSVSLSFTLLRWTFTFKGYKRKDDCDKLHYPHLIVMNSEGEEGSIFFFFKDPNRKLVPGRGFYPNVVDSTSFGEQDGEFSKVMKRYFPFIHKTPQDSSDTTDTQKLRVRDDV